MNAEGGAAAKKVPAQDIPENEDGESDDDNEDDQGAAEPGSIGGSIYIFPFLSLFPK